MRSREFRVPFVFADMKRGICYDDSSFFSKFESEAEDGRLLFVFSVCAFEPVSWLSGGDVACSERGCGDLIPSPSRVVGGLVVRTLTAEHLERGEGR